MGVDLRNEQGQAITFDYVAWSFLLDLARHYGWRPQGTAPPPAWDATSPWSGSYDSSDGQIIAAADAENFSAALVSALADPDFELRVAAIEKRYTKEVWTAYGYEQAAAIAPDLRQRLRGIVEEFARFYRTGPLWIL